MKIAVAGTGYIGSSTVTKIPDSYHVEYDNHYYSVVYTHCRKTAIIKATSSEIYICDEYN